MTYTKLAKMLLALFILTVPIINCNAAEAVSQVESDKARIFMLEKALAPTNPDQVASVFARANKERNGAVQFMLFSDELKTTYKNAWPYWVSGTSSPWITSYTINKRALNNNRFQFEITYEWATAQGPFSPSLQQKIIVEPVPKGINASQTWWITQMKDNSADVNN